jgi:hypothetical protein
VLHWCRGITVFKFSFASYTQKAYVETINRSRSHCVNRVEIRQTNIQKTVNVAVPSDQRQSLKHVYWHFRNFCFPSVDLLHILYLETMAPTNTPSVQLANIWTAAGKSRGGIASRMNQISDGSCCRRWSVGASQGRPCLTSASPNRRTVANSVV